MTTTKKEIIRAFLKSIETGDPAPLAHVKAYKQHNLGIADGLEGLGQVLQALPKGSARVRTVRLLEDGDYVVAHTEYEFFGPKVGFDVFRFEGERIVEHWDNLGERQASPNPSGRTQLDGPAEVTDRERTAANKELVMGFVKAILLGGQFDKLGQFVDGDRYLQHNPLIGDGVQALGAALAHLASQGQAIVYERVHRVLGEGNFVLTVSEGKLGPTPTAYYDLFRVENGKIVEHWDVIEAIPPRDQWANSNGKF
jgi:predicted SnoaL-like aldol condensation-catalyzing enzyme